jgi:hypothetical protein
MPGGLREPVKPRREQSAADKHHDDVDDQRPERSHGATIRFHADQAKREFGAILAWGASWGRVAQITILQSCLKEWAAGMSERQL